jgi:hypothetical protein
MKIMETTCICCNKSKDKISRILYSKDECELQVIFYYKLPTEMIRTIGEYLYQPELIKINHKTKSRNPLWLQYIDENRPPEDFDKIDDVIREDKTTYNCSSCFLYNFIKYKQKNPNTMPRIRNDIHWFNNILEKKEITSLFKEYFGDIFKFELPATYDMYFYRSFGLTIVKKNRETIIEEVKFKQTTGFCDYRTDIIKLTPIVIFDNDEIRKIIIPKK